LVERCSGGAPLHTGRCRAGERQRVGWARRVGRYRRQAFGWRASPLECDAPRALASSRVLRGWGRGEREAQGSVQGPHLIRGVSPFLATVPTSVHVHQCTREPHSHSEVVPRTLNSHRSTRGGFQQRSFALWEARPGVCFGTPPAAARPAPLSSRGATCLHTSHDRMGARTVATQRLVSRLAGAVESGVVRAAGVRCASGMAAGGSHEGWRAWSERASGWRGRRRGEMMHGFASSAVETTPQHFLVPMPVLSPLMVRSSYTPHACVHHSQLPYAGSGRTEPRRVGSRRPRHLPKAGTLRSGGCGPQTVRHGFPSRTLCPS
jgi:hypothetical protein